MKRREKPELIVARPNKERNYTNISIRRKANRIANTVRVNNCEIVKITKGKTSIIRQKIIGNQLEIVVPDKTPIAQLAFQIIRRLRGYKNVKIEIVGYEKTRSNKVKYNLAIEKCKLGRRVVIESNKGDDDDGSGTGGRHGRIKRRKK